MSNSSREVLPPSPFRVILSDRGSPKRRLHAGHALVNLSFEVMKYLLQLSLGQDMKRSKGGNAKALPP